MKSNHVCRGHNLRIAFGITVLVLLSADSASALSNSGGGSWQYYQDLTINNTGDALTDYQVLVNLTGGNFPINANSSGTDIRFTGVGGTELSYWIESWDYAGKSAKIWVKVLSIPATTTTTIRMYYGNPSATSSSNGNATFDFFDDFETNTIGTKWQINNGGLSDTGDEYAYIDSANGWAVIDSVWDESFVSKSFFLNRSAIVEMKWNFEGPFAGQGYTGGIQYYDPATTLNFNLYSYHAFSNSNGAVLRYGGTSGPPSDYGPDVIYYVSPNMWNIQRLTLTFSTIRSSLLSIDRSELSYAQIDNNEWNNKKVGMDNYNNGTAGAKLYIDYFLVRKYASSEPSVSAGSETINASNTSVDINITGVPFVGKSMKDILAVDYRNFNASDPYNISITRMNDSSVVYTTSGTLKGVRKETIPINWTPHDNRQYLVEARGNTIVNNATIVVSDSEVISPIPELSTIALMSAGLLGLFGLIKMQRRD